MSSPDASGFAASTDLVGKRVLIVEDEFYIAHQMARDLRDLGAVVVGPAPTLAAAHAAIADGSGLDGAIVDINLHGHRIYPLIDILLDRGVPCVFATGYDAQAVPSAYRTIPLCQKPMDTATIAKALFG